MSTPRLLHCNSCCLGERLLHFTKRSIPLLVLALLVAVIMLNIDLKAERRKNEVLQDQTSLLKALMEDRHILASMQDHSAMLTSLRNNTNVIAVVKSHRSMLDVLEDHHITLANIQNDADKLSLFLNTSGMLQDHLRMSGDNLITFRADSEILLDSSKHGHILQVLRKHDQMMKIMKDYISVLQKIQAFAHNLTIFENQIQKKWVNPAQKNIFLTLIDVVMNVARKKNISVFLHSDTLLGYARIRDILPWDDVVHLGMDQRERKKFEKEIGNLPNYRTHLVKESLLRFYSTTAFTVNYTNLPYKWPFLNFMLMKRTHNEVHNLFEGYKFSVDDIYPLQAVDFLGRQMFVPNNMDHVLEVHFGKDFMTMCEAKNFHHRLEDWESIKVSPRMVCRDIYLLYQQMLKTTLLS